VGREARAMTRREVITKAITKQLSWVQAAEILGISARHVRRLRRKLERWGMSAVMDQRGGPWWACWCIWTPRRMSGSRAC
jgi:transposase